MNEVLTKAEQIEEEFLRLYNEFNVAEAPERRKADIIDSFWEDIYKLLFKPSPDEIVYNNSKSNIKPYNVYEVEDICNTYIKLCQRYGGVIKIISFSNLTGIHRATFNIWHNANKSDGYIVNLNNNDVEEENKSIIYILNNNGVEVVYNGNGKGATSRINTDKLSTVRFDVLKKLREAIAGENTNGLSQDTMGHTVRANNDDDVGKFYKDSSSTVTVQVRALTDAELPKLGGGNEVKRLDVVE